MERAAYKCQLCGAIQAGDSISDKYIQIADVLRGDLRKPTFAAPMTLVHLCDDGNMGLAVFVGRLKSQGG